jgi:hypothetical protein
MLLTTEAQTKTDSPIAAESGASARAGMPEILYILSPSYSGSTLLTFLLAAHPDIATVGELKASAIRDVENYRCSCGALLTRCTFWRQVQQEMEVEGARLSFEDFGTHFWRGPRHFKKLVGAEVRYPMLAALFGLALQLSPPCRKELRTILDQNSRLIRVITRIQRGQIFLDGSKDPERLVQLHKRVGNKIKVVRLLRDGRGVANSYMKHYQVPMRVAVRELQKKEEACDVALARIPAANTITIKYENICHNAMQTTECILRFANLLPEKKSPQSAANFHILGNNMRLNTSKTVAPDEKWRTELTESDLALFDLVLGTRNRQMGYL